MTGLGRASVLAALMAGWTAVGTAWAGETLRPLESHVLGRI